MELAEKDYYPRLGATTNQIFYIQFMLLAQTLLIPFLFFITNNIYLTLIVYLGFFEFIIPLIFFTFLSHKSISYFLAEEYSMKRNKKFYKFFIALFITFGTTLLVYWLAFEESQEKFQKINLQYSFFNNKYLIFIISIAIPVIEEFHWRIYCMKAITPSNEWIVCLSFYYAVMMFFLVKSDDYCFWKEPVIFGILAFLYQLSFCFLKKAFRAIGTSLLHIVGNSAIILAFYLIA